VLQITAIKPQKKDSRFNIFLDGKFSFGLDEATLVREKLSVGQELSPERIATLTQANEVGKLLDKGLRFLSFRPRSEREVRRRLLRRQKRRGAEEEQGGLVGETISRLRDLGYINDAEFASWWVEQRIRFRPRGKLLLKSELFEKGVAREVIEDALREYSLEDEIGWAKKLAEKRRDECRERLAAYLARRGFTWEVVGRVLPR